MTGSGPIRNVEEWGPPILRSSSPNVAVGVVLFLKAIAEVEAAFEEIRSQATCLAPDEARNIEDCLFAAKAEADKGHFSRATFDCMVLGEILAKLAASLPTIRAYLQGRWTDLAETVPATLATLDRKLGNERRFAGMSRRWFDTARAKLHRLENAWNDARFVAQSGRLADAVILGEEARRRAAHLMELCQGF